MIKKIYISPYSMGSLLVFKKLENISFFKTYIPDIRFNTFFYTSLIQTGANVIEVFEDPEKLFNDSLEIKRRIIPANFRDFENVKKPVENLFAKYKSIKNKKTNKILSYSEILLTDLLYSLRTGSDLLLMGEIPNIRLYKNDLHPELFYLLDSLFSQIEQHDLFIPSPISTILKEEVKKFDSIINSDIYLDYSKAQSKLVGNKIISAINAIKNRAEKIVASNHQLLAVYNNLTLIIPFAKLLNPKFGELAKTTNSVLSQKSDLDNKQNIVIYKYRDVVFDHFKTNVKVLLGRHKKDLISWLIQGLDEAKKKGMNVKESLDYSKKFMTKRDKEKLSI